MRTLHHEHERRRHDRNQAIATLTGTATERRRDYWLGEYGSPESRTLYHRVVAEWEANGRRLIDPDFEKSAGSEGGDGEGAS